MSPCGPCAPEEDPKRPKKTHAEKVRAFQGFLETLKV